MVNRSELLSHGDVKAKEIALALMEEALKSADPYQAVVRALRVEGDRVTVGGDEFELKGRVYVVAFGKAACPMAKAVEDLLGDRIAGGVAITKYGYSFPLKKIKVIEAGHPVPDENSVRGALLGVEVAGMVGGDDLLLVLVSGGGSSLFALPEEGLTLEDKVRVNELLIKSGARIQEVNTVRKHLSRVKGGKLARLVKGTVISLIISDVVGDRLDVVASGPTVRDPSTFQDARRILEYYNLWSKLPERVRRHIELGVRGEREETLKEDLPNVHNYLVASSRIACESAARKAVELGLNAYILTTTLEGEAREVGVVLGSVIEEVYHKDRPFKKPCAIIAGGETTITITGEAGPGGPNQEVALSAARKIAGLRNTAVLAVDTDGTDGPTDAAGGLVDSYTLEVLNERKIDVEEYLRRHDTYTALKEAGALLVTGPTRTKVNSLVIAIVL